jgi:hypothetical protein
MSQQYIFWKWGNGGVMKKSLRVTEIPLANEIALVNEIALADTMPDKSHRPNDRELNSERMSKRELIIQTSINPFLSDHNYLDDLQMQDKFLRPKDSNFKIEEE